MQTTFTTTVLKDSEKNATGLPVPAEAVAALGAGKKPRVKVNLNGYTYRTTVAVLGGEFMLSLSAENREAAGVKPGDSVEITLELDTEPLTVVVPDDLAEALAATEGGREAFEALSYSVRKEYVRQVESAKAAETRQRRIAGIVAKVITH
jgi:bifunctional DNA-binding transcriptional regulator/antitoxin component of YhaV-PrlF toxin-antitoxin module